MLINILPLDAKIYINSFNQKLKHYSGKLKVVELCLKTITGCENKVTVKD